MPCLTIFQDKIRIWIAYHKPQALSFWDGHFCQNIPQEFKDGQQISLAWRRTFPCNIFHLHWTLKSHKCTAPENFPLQNFSASFLVSSNFPSCKYSETCWQARSSVRQPIFSAFSYTIKRCEREPTVCSEVLNGSEFLVFSLETIASIRNFVYRLNITAEGKTFKASS